MIKIRKLNIEGVKSYLAGVFIYGLGILLFRNLGYYKETLNPLAQQTLLYLFIGYLAAAPFYYLFSSKPNKSRPYLFLAGIDKLLKQPRNKKYKLDHEEKTAVLFLLVKLFFLPTMIDFFYDNLNSLLGMTKNIEWYFFLLTFIFMADTLIFSFGYAFEFKFLGNTVKSVEPTLFGWFVALICYPPFNSIADVFVAWGANDYVYFWNPFLTNFLRVLLVLLLLVYLWASVALGFKASNLTNRGIVTKFPYSIIRHPAYVSKNLAWWITLLPVLSWKFALGMAFWTAIYYFRAITEENHLSQDEEYVKYCRKVKYRFIPYVI